MPLVRIDIPQHWPGPRIAALADAVHDALVETVDVPADRPLPDHHGACAASG